MFGLFSALEMGKRALMAQQLGMTTSGHNISNVNTPGYSRQRVDIQATLPLYTPQGAIGTGSTAVNVAHVRDLFLNRQFRTDNSNHNQWQMTHTSLSQIEGFFNEPGDTGFAQLLTDFWNSWESLATNPTTASAVIEKSKALINAFHEHAGRLAELRHSVNTDISLKIGRINQLSQQLASLNSQIVSMEGGGKVANDLRDRRDLLIDELSSLTEVRTIDRDNGSVAVLLGSMTLVDGAHALKIETRITGSSNDTITTVYWENTSFEIDFNGGKLFALEEIRDKLIPEFQGKLDDLAEGLITAVNAIHTAGIAANGSTDVPFFNPFLTTAATISLSSEIENDPGNVAASISGEPGDTRNAQAISELRYSKIMATNSMTVNDFYADLIGTLGIKVEEANNLEKNYSLLVTQLENSRQSVQGVSTDEEMTNMIRYQRAYEAAARVITYVDSALQTIITGMGMTR